MKYIYLIALVTTLCLTLSGLAYAKTKAEKECLEKAPGSPKVAAIMCEGTTSLKPIECFKQAHGSDLAAAIVHSGAKSLAPLACFFETPSGTNMEIAIMCSGTTLKNWKSRVKYFNDAPYGSDREAAMGCAKKGLRWSLYVDM